MSVDSDNDDVPQLSAEALKALNEFYEENQANSTSITEDWVSFSLYLNNLIIKLNCLIQQLSQFWYDKNTSETLTKEVLTLAFDSKE